MKSEDLRFSAAADRNKGPILEVLARVLPGGSFIRICRRRRSGPTTERQASTYQPTRDRST